MAARASSLALLALVALCIGWPLSLPSTIHTYGSTNTFLFSLVLCLTQSLVRIMERPRSWKPPPPPCHPRTATGTLAAAPSPSVFPTTVSANGTVVALCAWSSSCGSTRTSRVSLATARRKTNTSASALFFAKGGLLLAPNGRLV
jgi:hypothetical protein